MSEETQTKAAKGRKKAKPQRKSMTLFFVKGLGALLPIVLTIFVFVTVVNFARTYVTKPINNTIYWSLEGNGWGWNLLRGLDEPFTIDPYDAKFLDPELLPTSPTNLQHFYEELGADDEYFEQVLQEERDTRETFFRDLDDLFIDEEKLRDAVSSVIHPAIGILASVLLVIWIGWIMTGIVGRKLMAKFDEALGSIPGVRSIYPLTKQLVDFFVSDNELEFDTVVAAPYPNANIYAIAFVTSEGLKTINEAKDGRRYVSMFVPTSPMPMTGYTVFIDADELIPLPISVDEALRVTVSAGVLIPPQERVEDLESALDELAAAAEQPPQGVAQAHQSPTRARSLSLSESNVNTEYTWYQFSRSTVRLWSIAPASTWSLPKVNSWMSCLT